MIVDANILLYAVDEESPSHRVAARWMEEALVGTRRTGLPWLSLLAFVRIATSHRAIRSPLSPAEAWSQVEDWLAAPAAWVPEPGRAHREILGQLVTGMDLRGNLVTDAALAALAMEHGVAVISADTDFARFPDLTWINPLRA